MDVKASLIAIANAISTDLKRSRQIPPPDMIERLLQSLPGVELILVDLLISEGQKAKPRAQILEVLAEMLFVAVETLRRRIDGRHAEAIATLGKINDLLRARANSRQMRLNEFAQIGQCFARAKLDPGEDIRELATLLAPPDAPAASKARRKRGGDASEDVTPEMILGHMAAVAHSFGDDPFATFAQIDEMVSAFPQDAKAMFCGVLATAAQVAVGEAALGFLLDRSETVWQAVLVGLATALANGHVSQASAQRLVLMRNWLPAARQPQFDNFLKNVRLATAAQKQPLPRRSLLAPESLFMSGCDGAGAQTMLAVCKEGRKFGLASILVKHDFGIRDAFVLHGLRKSELDAMFEQINTQTASLPTTTETIAVLIDHGLADNMASGEPPPFGLIEVLETVGYGMRVPHQITTEALVGQLLAGLPDRRTDARALKAALQRSGEWHGQDPVVASWFEDDDRLVALLQGQPKTRHADLILTQFLPLRRSFWAHRLAWTALSLKHGPDDIDCIDHALLARELLGTRDLATMPVMTMIAEASAKAYAANQR